MSGQNWKAGLALMAAVLAFWAGMQFQVIRDHDRCLDQGGALQPGRHPLCVAKSASETGLWIGPLQIRAGDIVAIEHAGAAPRLVLTLDPAAAKPLHEYTRQHIGHELAIRVNGRVIQQMSIVQALGATFVLPDLDVQDAVVLQQMLAPEPTGPGASAAR